MRKARIGAALLQALELILAAFSAFIAVILAALGLSARACLARGSDAGAA
jgi:hypothetical protein